MKAQVNIKAFKVRVLRDGDRIGVCIGNSLSDGVAGYGDDVPGALEDLARHLRDSPEVPEAPERHKLRNELAHPFGAPRPKGKLLEFPGQE